MDEEQFYQMCLKHLRINLKEEDDKIKVQLLFRKTDTEHSYADSDSIYYEYLEIDSDSIQIG